MNPSVIACNNIIDFPVDLSPTKTLLLTILSLSSSSISFAYSIVSPLINIAGRLNIPHPCVGLKAFAALN